MQSAVIASSYPFLDVVWTMFIFFAFVIWIWLLIMILADNFAATGPLRLGEGRLDALRDLHCRCSACWST